MVQVHSVDSLGTQLEMERVHYITTIELLFKDDRLWHLVNKSVLCDIIYTVNFSWAQSMQYSKTHLEQDWYIMNTDVSLQNIVLTEELEIKILDPESYELLETTPGERWAFDYSEKYYMTQINLMSKIQKFNYV